MSNAMQQPPIPGPPYPPRVAGVGGVPSVIPDVPVLAVFVAIYLTSFVVNISLFNINRRKGHLFVPSGALGGFSMARVLTCCLRIGWATHQTNISLAIAAMIFVNAGILVVYVINILFAQRILRAKQPHLGWNRALKVAFLIAYSLVGVALVLVIVLSVMTFYTLDEATLSDARWIQRSASLYLLIVTLMPLVLLALAYGLPRPEYAETFGEGSMTSKTAILCIGSCLCILIAGFRTGVQWSGPRPITNPAWYDSKAAFYCFNFLLEVLILILYTGMRVDKRFFVPNGSSKRQSYAVEKTTEDEENTSERDVEKEEQKDSSLN